MLNSAGHVMPPERGADHTAKAVPGTGGMQHSSVSFVSPAKEGAKYASVGSSPHIQSKSFL